MRNKQHMNQMQTLAEENLLQIVCFTSKFDSSSVRVLLVQDPNINVDECSVVSVTLG